MSLIAHLQTIPDFRAARDQRHPLWLVLILIILGAMVGYWGYRSLAEFVEVYGKEICQKLELAPDTKLPSYSTFRRVMQGLDYDVLADAFTDPCDICFAAWAQVQYEVEAGEWFAIDGKGIKGSVTDSGTAQQNFVSLVSLFSHQRGVVQAVMPMEHKQTSEREVVRVLLGVVGLSGIGVTLDALHCQKTLYEIVKQGNDYRVCVKANQRRLYRGIEQQFKTNQPLGHYQEHEQRHGRSTTWTVSVFDGVAAFGHEWVGIQRCIAVQRHGYRDGRPFDEQQYYISSVITSAEQFHRVIRRHWRIENRLHWVKDVVFNEDNAPHPGRNASANWSVVRNGNCKATVGESTPANISSPTMKQPCPFAFALFRDCYGFVHAVH